MQLISFDTLKLPRRVPRDVLLAALLLVGCEAAARAYFVADGSLRQLITGYVERLNGEQPETWICGNSTMNAAIDAEEIRQRLDGTVIKLAHGTATFRASVELLDHYLNQTTAPPQTLIFCTFKDDLNPNGYNARVSELFEDVLTADSSEFDSKEWLRLSSARNRIALTVQTLLSTAWRTWSDDQATEVAVQSVEFSGAPIAAGDPFFSDAARNYEIDVSAFDRLQQIVEEHGIHRCVVMLLPTSQPYIDFHNTLHPQQTYDEIRQELAVLCTRRSFEFVDQGGPWSEHDLFRDPYHLNDKGRQRLMQTVLPRLAPMLSFHSVKPSNQ